MGPNHDQFEERLAFAQQILEDSFTDIEETTITPLGYSPESPFKSNNFVYRIDLPHPLTKGRIVDKALRYSCRQVPVGTQQLVLRLSNALSETMHAFNRTENEVAMLTLASAALKDTEHHSIVPNVYDWDTVATGSPFGYILQQCMDGITIDKYLESFPMEASKDKLFTQMAEIINAFQRYELPDGITGYGGVTFDANGRLISGQLPSLGDGPWPTFEEYFLAEFRIALELADDNKYIQGWHASGVREKIDEFVAERIPLAFAGLSSRAEKCITHADFSPTNILVDPTDARITGLLDYDFSGIMHPMYEFLRSFDGLGGRFEGWALEKSEVGDQLRHAKLHGFPSPLPADVDGGVMWSYAKLWEEKLEALGVKRPRVIEGIEGVTLVDDVLSMILPLRLSNTDMWRIQSEEVKLQHRADCERKLMALLQRIN